jgi:ubiquitin carboxyl-terminal hydrolase 25/28
MFFESAEGGAFQGQAPVQSVFVHPIIGVEEEGKDLYDCLGELYLRGSEIEYEGRKGYIMDLMDQFPPLLYIQMRVRRCWVGADNLAIAVRHCHRP